MYFVII